MIGLTGKWIRQKRFLSAIFATVMLTGLCGCGQNAQSTPTSQEMEPVTFRFYSADGFEDPWTDPVAQAITAATGVTLETQYPSDLRDSSVELMIATGELADLIFAKGDSELLIEKGALIDMSPLIDEYGPHIKELYGDEYERLRYSAEDPAIYQLCSGKVGNETIETAGTAQLQWAVIAYNDYRIPRTLEEYTQFLKNYMDKHLEIDGKQTIGISISVTDWHWYTTLSNPSGFIANGAPDNGQWIVTDQNEVIYKHTADRQKEYFAWLNEMYAQRLLDPEFATQTHQTYIDKIASGRVLGLLDADWDIMDAQRSLREQGKFERTYAALPVTIDESVKCATLAPQGLTIGWGIGISTACKDPVRAVQFLDWMCTEEAQILLNWGIEGVNYYYDEDGVRLRSYDEMLRSITSTTYSEETGVGRHTYPFPSYGNTVIDSTGNYISQNSKPRLAESYDIAQKTALTQWKVNYLTDIFPQADEFELPEYTPLWAKTIPQEINVQLEKLDEIAWKGLIGCIVCPTDQFDRKWEELQQQLEEAGVREAEKRMTQLLSEELANRYK